MATYRFVLDGRPGEIPLSEPPVSTRQLEEIVRRAAKLPRQTGSSFDWPDDPAKTVKAPAPNPIAGFPAAVPPPPEAPPPTIGEQALQKVGGAAETLGVTPPQSLEDTRSRALEMGKRGVLPTAGGIIGAAAGAAVGGPSVLGVPAGVIAGEALGSATGEAINQFLGLAGKNPEEVFLAMAAPVAGRAVSAAGQFAAKQLMKHTAGGKAALHQAGAVEAEHATDFIPRGQAAPIYRMLDDAIETIRKDPRVTMPQVQVSEATKTTRELLMRELQKLPITRDNETAGKLLQTLQILDNSMLRGGMSLDKFVEQMPALREAIAATRPGYGKQVYATHHGALKKLESAFLADMDVAIAKAEQAAQAQMGGMPGVRALAGQVAPGAPVKTAQTIFTGEYLKNLKTAVRLYRLESGATALEEHIVNKGMHLRAGDNLLELKPGKVTERLRTDDYLRESLGPENTAKLDEFFERLAKIPQLEPAKGQQFGSGMGLRRMSVGFLVGGWKGAVGMELGAYMLSRISLTDSGRRFLLRLFTHGVTLDAPRMAAMSNFLRAQAAPGRAEETVE